jgi:PKD domain
VLVALGLWLFMWGPFAAGKARNKNQAKKKVEAESGSRSTSGWSFKDLPSDYAGSTGLVSESAPSSVAATEESPVGTAEVPVRSEPPPTPAAEPAPPPINHAPSVSISGPTLVHVGETATYRANASDPDGDSLSYSWGGASRNKCWQTPGQYSVSVTVTDSGGHSASASLLVEVMQ